MAYAALSYDELAARTRIGESTLRRIASPTKPRGATLDEQWLIADACNVPRRWLEHEWVDAKALDDAKLEGRQADELAHELGHALFERPLLGEGDTEERLRMLERYVHALLLEQERRRPDLVPPRPERPRRRTSTASE